MRFATLLATLLGLTPALAAEPMPAKLARYFDPPPEMAEKFGKYRSPLLFDDGSPVKTPADWKRRRQELMTAWHGLMGPWPKPIERPSVEILDTMKADGFDRHHLRIEVAPGHKTEDAYLLVPHGKGPFPAVVVVFYDALTGVGGGKKSHRDFALQLAKRGFVALSLGSAPETYYPNKAECKLQPLSYHAYEASTCRRALANRPDVDPKRIGVVGHSYGGKWAMFAGCLDEEFAFTAVSDPGIVFDEPRSNVNYWERWYLGFEAGKERKPGLVTAANPRTGPYAKMVAAGRDLHELQALLAPRPFFVSGGSEDPIERWEALNHLVKVNQLLGVKQRVGMTVRPGHDPTDESNDILFGAFEYFLKR